MALLLLMMMSVLGKIHPKGGEAASTPLSTTKTPPFPLLQRDWDKALCFNDWAPPNPKKKEKKIQSLMIQVLVQMGKFSENRKKWVFFDKG